MKNYKAYLLRIWSDERPDASAWRASLEDPHTHKVIQFDCLAALSAYLLDQTADQSQPLSQLPAQETEKQ